MRRPDGRTYPLAPSLKGRGTAGGRGRDAGGRCPYTRWSKAAGGAVLGWQDALGGWWVVGGGPLPGPPPELAPGEGARRRPAVVQRLDCGFRRNDEAEGGGGLGAGAEAEEVGVAEGEGEADALAGEFG